MVNDIRNEEEMEQFLNDVLYDMIDDEEHGDLYDVSTYKEEELLTYNKGIVVKFANGAEFQLTIVQSGRPYKDDDDEDDDDDENNE